MTQVSILDSGKLSSLLKDALSWNENISSLLVSAKNGSILACAFRNAVPSIKALRTQSTSMTAAYSATPESTLVFESQDSETISVITSVADHILLAVSNGEPDEPNATAHALYKSHMQSGEEMERNGAESEEQPPAETNAENIRRELEEVCEELGDILRSELTGVKWPEDI